jgi:hypothetical protein
MAEGKRASSRPKRDRGNSPEERGRGDYSGGDEEYSEPLGIHADFLNRYYGGGEAATPELFARASAVWQRLPGAATCLPAGFADLAGDVPPEEELPAAEVAI